MDNLNSLLQTLGIDKRPEEQDGKYVINLKDSDEFARVYSKLDLCKDVDLENVDMDEHLSTAFYLSDDFDIELVGNFDEDVYTLTFKEAQ